MFKLLKKILIVLVVLIIGFLIVVAMQSDQFLVQRTTIINAPQDVVFAQVNDFHNWEPWSPWAKLDPASKVTFEGPAAGKGAMFSWDGNDQVGAGKMTILDSHASDLVKINLAFVKPYKSEALAQFDFKPQGDQTAVTWSMSGHKNFFQKGFCMFMNMDKMVGGDFEKGLASMKSVSEAAAKK